MEIECEHCGNSFSSKTNLTTHQKTSKYCLDKRGERCEEFRCEDCEKTFTLKSTLFKHQKICKVLITRLQYEDQIVQLKKQLSEKTLGAINKEAELEISNSYLDKTTAEFIALKHQFRALKRSHLKLEMELEKEKELVSFYKRSSTMPTPKTSSRRSKLDRVTTSKTFVCTTEGLLAKIPTDYVLRNGLEGLLKFIKPMIKDGKNRCYVRTDPTRSHYNKFDGITWEHDRNGLFIREVLDIMKPYVKQCYKDLGNETLTCEQDEKDKISNEFHALTPLSQGIIHSNGNERNVLIGEIAAKLAHITDI